MSFDATILIVPGLRDHLPDHWQTHLAASIPGALSVPPLGREMLSLDVRVEALDGAIRAISGPVILVAHSAGVMIAVHWAARHRRPVKGALFAAPADVEEPFPPGYPMQAALAAAGWLPIPREPLPFPSLVAASRNDPLGRFDRIEGMARDWGSRLVDLGSVGHLNPAAGFGPWPEALDLVASLDRGGGAFAMSRSP